MTEVQVKMNDGTKFYVELDQYDERAMKKQLNDPENTMVSIGRAIVQRYNVSSIMPLDMLDDVDLPLQDGQENPPEEDPVE